MPRVKPSVGGLIDRPSRFGIFARRQRRLARPVLVSVVLVGLAAGGLHLAHLMRNEASFAPLRAELGRRVAMRITAIAVSGRDMTPEAQVDQAIGVRVGDDILGFSVEAARRRLDALAFVERATVERRLPGTVVVQLVERRPFAVWQNHGRFVLIDRKGAVVADQGMNGKDAEAFAELPLVVGLGAPEAADALITDLAAEPTVRAHVVAAVRVGQRRWDLTLRNGCDVMLPEGEEPAALHRLALLQRDQQLLARPLAAIDMRLGDRLVVRPRPVAADASAAPSTGTVPGTKPGAPSDAPPADNPDPGADARDTGRRPA